METLENPFAVQADVRKPWRGYLDRLASLRPELHRYCTRLTGSVWEGEDLVQDTLARVFSMLGKIDADLTNPRAYLIRTATNLWIDRVRRTAREAELLQLEAAADTGHSDPPKSDMHAATKTMFQSLHPQERAAITMKDVLDLSLEETAGVLKTSVGAVKAALNRARGRLAERRPSAGFGAPPRELVERFMAALRDKDLEGLRTLCSTDLSIDLVGGAQMDGFEQGRGFFEHAHMVFPALGFGENPWWELADYQGEPMVIGYRTLDGVEGINEIHRLEVEEGKVSRVRCYCFAPDTLRWVAADLGKVALDRRYRSPDPKG